LDLILQLLNLIVDLQVLEINIPNLSKIDFFSDLNVFYFRIEVQALDEVIFIVNLGF
jgi:hypothetical protein